MPFGSVLANAKEVTLETADEQTVVVKGFAAKLALRLIGIPHIGMRVRAREVMGSIQRYFYKNARILDAGCGIGVHSLELIASGYNNLIAIDSDKNKILLAQRAHPHGIAHFFEGDITNPQDIAFRYKQYDVIILSDVLEHIEDDIKVADNIMRVLAPGGILIVTAPTKHPGNAQYRQQFGHYREYSKECLSTLFSECGIIYYKPLIRSLGRLAWKLNRATFSNKVLAVLTWPFLYALTYIDWSGDGMSQIMVLKRYRYGG